MPAVARKGDADVPHCSAMDRAGASSNVFCNGLGISRAGDHNTSHVLPAVPVCVGHTAPDHERQQHGFRQRARLWARGRCADGVHECR